MTPPKNISASVRQRLLNQAKGDRRPFNELLQYYAMERFLYRLSLSHHANRFILKGALMLRIWQAPEIRPTMDIDLLGRTNNDISQLTSIVEDILSVEIEPDGLIFFTEQIKVETIAEEAEYQLADQHHEQDRQRTQTEQHRRVVAGQHQPHRKQEQGHIDDMAQLAHTGSRLAAAGV